MKNRALALLVLVGSLLLNACHTGMITSGINTNTTLTSNNYRVVMTGVKGEDAGFRVFGFGQSAAHHKAMDKIRVQAQMDERPRALVNITVDDSHWNIGIVAASYLTITADVIEFTGPPNGN
jgi:hypothetical protein